MTYETRTCRQCGISFEPFRKNQDFCTVECRKAWWEWYWVHSEHKCPSCGELHTPGGGNIVGKIREVLNNEEAWKDSVLVDKIAELLGAKGF